MILKEKDRKIVDASELWNWRKLLRIPWTGKKTTNRSPLNFFSFICLKIYTCLFITALYIPKYLLVHRCLFQHKYVTVATLWSRLWQGWDSIQPVCDFQPCEEWLLLQVIMKAWSVVTSLPARRRDDKADSRSGRGCTHRWREVSSNLCSVFVGGEKAFVCLLRTGKACFLEISFWGGFLLPPSLCLLKVFPAKLALKQGLHCFLSQNSLPVWDYNLHNSTYLKSASLRKFVFKTGTWERGRESGPDIFFSSHYKPTAFRDLLERDCVMSCIVRVPTNRQCTCCSLQQHNILLHFFSFCLLTPSSPLGLLSLKYFLYCCTCKMWVLPMLIFSTSG